MRPGHTSDGTRVCGARIGYHNRIVLPAGNLYQIEDLLEFFEVVT